MPTVADLRSDHLVLAEIVRELGTLIKSDVPPQPVELFDVRRRLSSKLIAHLKAEDWLLYPPLLQSEDPEVAAIARRFVDEMGGLASAYARFDERWDALLIASNWDDYRSDARSIIETLTNRIARENRELYPLLERTAKAA